MKALDSKHEQMVFHLQKMEEIRKTYDSDVNGAQVSAIFRKPLEFKIVFIFLSSICLGNLKSALTTTGMIMITLHDLWN